MLRDIPSSMHLEMRPFRDFGKLKIPEKTYSRRRFLALSVASALSMGLKDKEQSAFRQLGNFTADIFSHNADTISKIERSLGIPAIEMDIAQLPNGKLVVGHSLEEFNVLPIEQQLQLEPRSVAQKIRLQGSRPHFDVKLEPDKPIIDEAEYINLLQEEATYGPTTVSTPHHEFLWNLHRSGFDGQILFTLRDPGAVKNFLNTYKKENFKNGSFGVSIRFTALSEKVVKQLKERGLYVLAWTPNTSLGVLSALKSGADGITSDMPHLLKQIGKYVPKAA